MPESRRDSSDHVQQDRGLDDVPDDVTSYDPDYFRRHRLRNRRRTAAVVRSMHPGDVLDVGCNRGYFSQAIIDARLTGHVDAVEPSRSQVSPRLLDHPDFTLHEQSISAFVPTRSYQTILYLAVHHHVLATEGYVQAMDVWRGLVARCTGQLYFETGQLLEGPRWYWQRALGRRFSSDEEHIGVLAQAIGPRLRGLEVVCTSFIHGAPRWLVRFDLSTSDTTPPVDHPGPDTGTVVATYRRTRGSSAQTLVETTPTSRPRGDATVFPGVTFRAISDDAGGDVVLWNKQSHDDPLKDRREYEIGRQVGHGGPFIRPVGYSPSRGLFFPFVPGATLAQTLDEWGSLSPEVLRDYLGLLRAASVQRVTLGVLDLVPAARTGTVRRLIDVVDLHPSNVIRTGDGGTSGRDAGPYLVAVDLQYYANSTRARNRRHAIALILRTRPVPGREALEALLWVPAILAHHVRWETAPVEVRILEGYGARHRHLVRMLRAVVDRALRSFPGYWQ